MLYVNYMTVKKKKKGKEKQVHKELMEKRI